MKKILLLFVFLNLCMSSCTKDSLDLDLQSTTESSLCESMLLSIHRSSTSFSRNGMVTFSLERDQFSADLDIDSDYQVVWTINGEVYLQSIAAKTIESNPNRLSNIAITFDEVVGFNQITACALVVIGDCETKEVCFEESIEVLPSIAAEEKEEILVNEGSCLTNDLTIDYKINASIARGRDREPSLMFVLNRNDNDIDLFTNQDYEVTWVVNGEVYQEGAMNIREDVLSSINYPLSKFNTFAIPNICAEVKLGSCEAKTFCFELARNRGVIKK